jgi:uncharacterized membrane protein YebE (DUF533 family)
MNTGETLLVVGAVAVVGYLVYKNYQPAPGPVVIQSGGPPAALESNKYDFYTAVTRESGDVARELIKAASSSQTPPATRTAP